MELSAARECRGWDDIAKVRIKQLTQFVVGVKFMCLLCFRDDSSLFPRN